MGYAEVRAIDYWRLADDLTVEQAAILAAGIDPVEVDYPTRVPGFTPIYEALKGAVLANRLAASLVYPNRGWDPDGHEFARDHFLSVKSNSRLELLRGTQSPEIVTARLHEEPDWTRTTVAVEDLKAWFQSKGFSPSFFFPQGDPNSEMNKAHPRYAPKLACAVAAWREIEGPSRNKSVKQTVEAWVTANGVNFGLRNEDGVVPSAAVEEIAKVVNWQPQGGAARTGGQVLETSPPVPAAQPDNYEPMPARSPYGGTDLDDDIPF